MKDSIRIAVVGSVVLVVTVASMNAWAVGWVVQSSPNPSATVNVLNGVSMNGASNAWAVGYWNTSKGVRRTLIEHYDGATWSKQASPNPTKHDNQLLAVKATSADNVWAVGYYRSFTGAAYKTLVERYNGSTWSTQGTKNYSDCENFLYGVAATSSTNAWAVGYTECSDYFPLIEHYDGTAWKIQSDPHDNGACILNGVGASSATSAWAVGVCSAYVPNALILHYNGTNWSAQTSAVVPVSLKGVAVRSSSDVWAVGAGDLEDGVIEHYDGANWSAMSVPQLGVPEELFGVRAPSATNAYAVGAYYDSGQGAYRTLVLHWDGVTWSVQSTPSQGSRDNFLYGVAATSTNAFAVGPEYTSSDDSTSKTLVLGCC